MKEWKLEDILESPIARFHFKAFLAKSYAEENLNFLEGVQKFVHVATKSPKEQVAFEALRLYKEFLDSSAPTPVNVPHTVSIRIKEFNSLTFLASPDM